MRKRIFNYIIIACLMVLFAIGIFAADSGSCGANATWEFSGGTLTISGSGDMEDYGSMDAPWYSLRSEITAAVVAEGITSVGKNAFDFLTRLKSVSLPNGLTEIRASAFSQCSGLREIDFPDTLTKIGDSAFNASGIKYIRLPARVESIGNAAFASGSLIAVEADAENQKYCAEDGVLFDKEKTRIYCYPAEKEGARYTIPESVTRIEERAFSNCDNLRSVVLTENVTRIGWSAFFGCRNMDSIYIPSSVTAIEQHAFDYCHNLTIYGEKGSYAEEYAKKNELTFTTEPFQENTVEWFIDVNGTLTFYGKGSIPYYALGQAPWYSQAPQIKALVLEEGITGIGALAFSHCYHMIRVTIPSTVTYIGDSAFQSCDALKEFIVDADNSDFTAYEGVLFDKQRKTVLCYPESKEDKIYAIPDGVTTIADAAFNGAHFKNVMLPDSLRTIEESAFMNCAELETVTVPNGVTEIPRMSFSCQNLRGIYIPASVKTIKNPFSSYADKLIIYGEKGSAAEKFALEEGYAFSDDEMPETFFAWELKNGVLTVSGMANMPDYDYNRRNTPWEAERANIRELVIEEGLTSVGDGAFHGCSNLQKVTLPSGITQIGDNAFAYCSALQEVALPDSLTSIGDGAFQRSSLTAIDFPEGLVSIGNDAFMSADLTELVLPESLENIGERAFAFCSHIKKISVDADNRFFMAEDGVLYTKDKSGLLCYPGGKTAKVFFVPQETEALDPYSIRSSVYLLAMVLHKDVTEIGDQAFNPLRVVIYGDADSYAAQYAKENEVDFKEWDASPDLFGAADFRLEDVFVQLKNMQSGKELPMLIGMLQALTIE